jgi:SPP1 family predicted phage head-tail adaptor
VKAGARNRLITVQRNMGVTTDDYGAEVPDWQTYTTAFAEVRFGTGQERREAAQESATAAVTFRVLHNAMTASVTPKDRISFDGSLFDITSNIPSIELNQHREITAIRVI